MTSSRALSPVRQDTDVIQRTMIPVQDLKRHYEPMAEAMKRAAVRVLDSGWYVLGQEVRSFEKEFAGFLGANDCVSVANGTDALELALRALQIGPGDEVCTAANAGMYSTAAILNVGATPAFVDIDPASLTMSPEALASALNPRTKAVIVTHLYGCVADLRNLLDVAQKHGLRVIEDCAQAHGAKWDGKCVGTFGDLGCFSFYPTKNLGGLGDGGAISVRDPGLAERLRALRQYGWTARYRATIPGGRNSRLDELQAAFLREKLPMVDVWNARRRQIATMYNHAFSATGLVLPQLHGESHVVHLYVVRLPRRDELCRMLGEERVGSDIHYPTPDYRQTAVLEQLGEHVPLPQTELACQQVLTLPCFPELTDPEVDRVIAAVLAAVPRLRP